MTHSLAVDTDAVHERIVTGVAALEGVDPTALPPLFDAVDPDALTAIFATTVSGGERTGRISFRYVGHKVTVEFDGSDVPLVTID
ncbi:HalOD1 output domain-containing protein [Natrinema salinisoli]|uniref:HalOD1 output domain-containing protein n=1 Tax=Natrinema salinisoli TaxID=2878535 RepID=UPI001CF0D3A8|nr:HalOD1 output domain-containing protein [Natrinema salinisoli]